MCVYVCVCVNNSEVIFFLISFDSSIAMLSDWPSGVVYVILVFAVRQSVVSLLSQTVQVLTK